MAGELELASMLLHQLLEALERHNLPQRRMHSVRPGLGAENFRGFINELSVEPYGGYCHRSHLAYSKYTLAEIYPCVDSKPAIMLHGS